MTIENNMDACPSYMKTIGALDAMEISEGEGATILMLDTCIDTEHEALKGRVSNESPCKPIKPKTNAANFVKTFGTYIHGTAVSGVMIAKSSQFPLYNKNALANICGIAPKAHVQGFKYDLSNNDPDELTAQLDQLLQFKPTDKVAKSGKPVFTEYKQTSVIGSLSIAESGKRNKEDLNQFMKDACTKDSFLGIVAVGNDGVNLADHPDKYIPANLEKPKKCSYDPLLRVGSVDVSSKNIVKALKSNYGQKVDILAPGVNIPVAIPSGQAYIINGTSFAAPMVSGTIALLLKCKPLSKASALRSAIIDNADKYESLSHYVKDGRVLNVYNTVSNFCSDIQEPTKQQPHEEL